MIKILLCFITGMLFMLCGYAQTPWLISGKIKGAENKKVYLIENAFYKDVNKQDSVVASADGSFVFKEKMTEPSMFGLAVKGTGPIVNQFIIDGPKTKITSNADSLANIKIEGSKEDILFRKLLHGYNFQERINQFNIAAEKAKAKKDTAEISSIIDLKYKFYAFEVRDSLDKFISDHKGTFTSLLAFEQIRLTLDPAEHDRLFNLLKTSPAGKYTLFTYIENRIKAKKMLQPGMKAPDFTDTDLNGKKISVSSFRGKYVLLDFWASWCLPCRSDNPNLVKMYAAFKDKGFTIISVSLDTDKKSWQNAIVSDKLNWTHVSDLKGFNEHVTKLYGVYDVPHNFLIGKDGKVIARDLHGDDLANKLKELNIN